MRDIDHLLEPYKIVNTSSGYYYSLDDHDKIYKIKNISNTDSFYLEKRFFGKDWYTDSYMLIKIHEYTNDNGWVSSTVIRGNKDPLCKLTLLEALFIVELDRL